MRSAILVAIKEAGGIGDPRDSYTQIILEQTIGIQYLYHLDTADVGNFNGDTTAFYPWLVTYLREYFFKSTDGYRDRMSEHMRLQYMEAVHNPNSTLAIRLRIIAANSDLFFSGLDEDTYGAYLFYPVSLCGDFGQGTIDSVMIGYQQLKRDFDADRFSNKSTSSDLLDYLASIDYVPHLQDWGYDYRSLATATATTPTPAASSDDVPRDGVILYQRPLTEWRSEDEDTGWMGAKTGSFHIGVVGGDGHTMAAWTARAAFANVNASVDIREVTDQTASVGCIAVRHDVDQGEYQFCMLGDGGTWAAYDYVDDNGEWQIEVLMEAKIRHGTRPAPQWNTLKVVADETELWFLVNDVTVGTVQHDARSVGDIDIHVQNWDDAPAEWEFKNLIVRSVE